MKTFKKPFVALMLASFAIAGAHAATGDWLTSYDEAVKQAKKTGKPILADFTGSDWCGWCIKLHKEVFNTPEFKKWADKSVVLLELDYPQRTPQPAAVRRQNQEMLKRYPYIEGYPTILFLKSDGKAFGKFGYDVGGPVHWTQMADRLIKPKGTPTTRPRA
jgi:protein disulfide-isomerase